jgi:hypothetical protein
MPNDLEHAADPSQAIPGVNVSMLLATTILRVLEAESPGFRDKVKARIELTAQRLEDSDDATDRADAPSVREFLDGWLFKE